MASSLNYDFDNMQVAIDSLKKISLDLHNTLNNIYKLQEDFKKYKGGTYFETKFVTKKILDTYAIELDANINWIKKFHEALKDANSYVEGKIVVLAENVDATNIASDVINKSSLGSPVSSNDKLKKIDVSQKKSINDNSKLNDKSEKSIKKIDTENVKQDDVIDEKESIKSPLTDGGGYFAPEKGQAIVIEEKTPKVITDINVSMPKIRGKYDNSGENEFYDEISDSTLTVNVPEEYGITEKIGAEYVDSMMDSAKKIHDRMHGFSWGSGYLNVSEDDGTACCASYVSAVLVDAGVFSYDELADLHTVFSESGVPERSFTSFNAADDVYKYLRFVKGWERIDNPDDLQPGDICFYERDSDASYDYSDPWNTGECNTGHVDIYMGNNTKFSAGSAESMNYDNPESFSSSTWLCAYRPPKN